MRKLILLASLLASFSILVVADDVRPIAPNLATAGVGYNVHAVPWASYSRLMGGTVYETNDFYVIGKQIVGVAGACPVHLFGEYLVVGGCGQGGMSSKGGVLEGEGFFQYRFGKSHWSVVARPGLFDNVGGTKKFQAKLGVAFDWGGGQ